LTVTSVFLCFLTTLQLFKNYCCFRIAAPFSVLSGASEILSLCAYSVKLFTHKFYKIPKFQFRKKPHYPSCCFFSR